MEMGPNMWLVTGILLVTIYLLISEKIPFDLTGIGIIVVLMVSGVLTPEEAVSGFANPALVTVGAMFLVSRAMTRTGVVGFFGNKLLDLTRGRPAVSIMVVLVVVAVASAFINNTPVVVLFIPVMLSMGCRFGVSPSKYLIPLSYASILAGTCTLIGTSTNIIVSDLSLRYGYGSIGMFELARVGVPIALVGIIVILGFSNALMPDLLNPTCELDEGLNRRYLAEVSISRGSRLIGMAPCGNFKEKFPDIEVIELVRYSHIYQPCRDVVKIAPDDLLLVKGTPNALFNLLEDKGVQLPPTGNADSENSREDRVMVELIVTPTSSLIGQKLKESDLFRDFDLKIVAVERSGLHFTEKQIKDVQLRLGDILLVSCSSGTLAKLRPHTDWIIAEDVHETLVHKRKTPLTGIIFLLMITAASTGLADIMVCSITAVFLLIFSGCLQLKDAYRSLQGNVLMLIAGTIALGVAMEKTGTSRFLAELYVQALQGFPLPLILGGFIFLTSVSTHILSNNATAVLLMPIAISTAAGLGVQPRPFIMGVVFGASACFATPIGYQTNLMVYGPGGYKFKDYFRLGIPLNLIVIIGATLLIPIFWPF